MILVAADGGVTACNKLAIDDCGDRDVLADGKAKNIVFPRKLETIAVK